MNDYTQRRLEAFDARYAKAGIIGDRKFEEYLPNTFQDIKSFLSESIVQAEQEMLKRVELLAKGMLKHADGSKCVECSIASPFCKYDMAINDFIDHELPSLQAKPLTDKE